MPMPELFRRLEPPAPFAMPADPNENFSSTYLSRILGGTTKGEGFRVRKEEPDLFPGLKAYKRLDYSLNPLLPRVTGEHGA